MSTIDKFMVRTPNPSKDGPSAKKCTSSKFSQDTSEDEIKVRKRGKHKQLKDQSDECAYNEDVKINDGRGKATDGIFTESTVEISYEDYLNDNCDESTDLTETKDDSQNAGRDIRSFFSKGPATFKLQNNSFSTIKVKAEIHEPCSRLSGEALAGESPVILPGTFWKQKNGRRKCVKGFIEITDDDLVIECLDDEAIKSDEAGGLLKVPVGNKSDKAGGLLKIPVGSKSDEAGGLLKMPVESKSDEAGGLLKMQVESKSDEACGRLIAPVFSKLNETNGLLKAPVELISTLNNNDTIKLEYETITGVLQTKENHTPLSIVDERRGESSATPEITMTAPTLNGSVRERQNMNDVLMGKQKQLHDPDSQKQKRNSDGVSCNNKDKKPEAKKRGRGKVSQVNGCAKRECDDVDAGEKSLTGDDEVTRLYVPSVSSTAVCSVVVKPVSSDEVPEEEVPELPKELMRPNVKGGRSTTVNMSEALSQTESSKVDASPVAESEGRGLRRSQRQSALAAIAAITIAMQDSCSKRQKKAVAEDDETIDLDSDDTEPEEARGHHSRRPNKPKPDAEKIQSPSLAPIFMKRNATDVPKKSTPKLSAAEREAIQIKRNFLLSGVPVELKKIQNIQQLTALPLVDAPFPTHSHTYQSSSTDERSCSTVQPWCLPEVTLKLKDPSETVPPSVSAEMLHLGLLTSLSHSEEITEGDKIELGKLTETSKDMLPVLLSEVKFCNTSFPTDRVYHQLWMRKNRDSKAKPNDISKTSATSCVKEAAVKSKKLSKRKKVGHSDDVPCENAEDECSETPSLLWTEKYAPTQANEMIGNWDACKKLRDWLTEWKQVVSRHSSNKHFQSDRKQSDEGSGDFYSSDDNSSYADDDGSLCNTMLLLGAHGIGKTSMVYALAQELDFKVFEVNASGSRDGRYVLTQLQEATQSHQVSRGHQTDAAASEQHEEPTTDQTSVKTKIPKQSNPASGFLERWSAKQSQFQPEEPPPKKRLRRTRSIDSRSPSKKQQQLQQPQDTKAPNQDMRKPSLILFDEVDTVFDDDRGFWSAVQTFMKTTKRPIVLTATDRHFVEKFAGRFETLRLRTPRLVNTASYVQLICLLENVRTNYSDLLSLVEFFNGDIRKTLLSLQFWIDSGAARHLVSNQPVQRHVDTCHKDPQNSLAPESKTKDETMTTGGVSDDDFQSIVPRKRRRLQIWSDDESNSGLVSLSSRANNAPQVVEEVSQSCSLAPSDSEFCVDGEAAVDELRAMDEGLRVVLPLHRLSGRVVGVGSASAFCPLVQDPQKNCAAPFCQHQNLPLLDKQERCAEDIVRIDNKAKAMDDDSRMQQVSMKSLYAVYKNMSYTDVYCCAMRRHCADEDENGNTCWLLHDKADGAISDLEALLGSGVRRKDCEGKQNASVGEKAVAQAENGADQNRNSLCSRLRQENASIIEGTRQSVFQPASTLCTDYMPALRAICKSEELRKATSYRRRFCHYLSNALPTMKCSLYKNMALQFL